MKKVYECPIDKKAELTKILESEPYAEKSFSKAGYKLKNGKAVGEDEKKLYLYISAPEDFFPFADEELKGLAEESKKEVADRVIEKIEKEESEAEKGFGSIFGE